MLIRSLIAVPLVLLVACDVVEECGDKAEMVAEEVEAECRAAAEDAKNECRAEAEKTKDWIEEWWRGALQESIDEFAGSSGCAADPSKPFGWDCRRSSLCNPPDAGAP